MRLIDADALLPMMKYATTDSEIGVFPIKIGFNAIAKVIDDAPTVDAVPVRHGKWKKTPSNWGSMFECSECGEKAVETVMGKPRFIYCPMCGCRMDK